LGINDNEGSWILVTDCRMLITTPMITAVTAPEPRLQATCSPTP
jgi:hypothetical protein